MAEIPKEEAVEGVESLRITIARAIRLADTLELSLVAARLAHASEAMPPAE